MKVKGRWEHLLAAGWCLPVSARRSDRPRGVGGSSCVPVGWVSGGICAARSARRSCRRCCQALGCRWARVTDEAKRRRQELVVCRAALPFEGLIYARCSVTPAPAFLAGLPACGRRPFACRRSRPLGEFALSVAEHVVGSPDADGAWGVLRGAGGDLEAPELLL